MPDQPSLPKLAAAADRLDAWLERMSVKHEENLALAYAAMTRRVRTLLEDLETERGRLLSTRANLAQAQELHRQFTVVAEGTILRWVDRTLAVDLDRVATRSARLLSTITGEPQRYVGVDRTWVARLKRLPLDEFHRLGEESVDRVARAMYEHLAAGARFRDLERTVRNELVGVKDVVGRPMTAHAQRMAFDATRNYQNQVTTYKAAKIGLNTYIYYGDVILDSRPFCVEHAGEVMSETRIADLDRQVWRGKSGPFKTHRGGYRCRHSFLPVRREWVQGREVEVQNAFTETQGGG